MTKKKVENKKYVIMYSDNECSDVVFQSLEHVKKELNNWETEDIGGVTVCELVPKFNVFADSIRYEEIK